MYPDAQILPLDYDPDVSFANVENRLQMLIMNMKSSKETAKTEHMKEEEPGVNELQESAEELMESMKVLRKNTALQCLSDMSQGEMAVLCYLLFSHNGASAGELTAEFKVRSSRTAAILNGLERKGYAVRSSDPEDKRRVRVYITEKGKNLPERA